METEVKTVQIMEITTKPEPDPYQAQTGAPSHTMLILSPQERKVWVRQEYRTNSTTMDLYHGVDLDMPIEGHPDPEEVRNVLTENMELLVEICNEHTVEWDGSNHKGWLSEAGLTAWHTLETLLNSLVSDHWQYWDIHDWCYEWVRENMTAKITDEELAAMIKELESLAEIERVVLSDTIDSHLTQHREWLKEQDD